MTLAPVLRALSRPSDVGAFYAALLSLHAGARRPADAPFPALVLAQQPEVLDVLARLLRRCRLGEAAPVGIEALAEVLEALDAAEDAAACGGAVPLDGGGSLAGFSALPPPHSLAVCSYVVSTLLVLVGGVEGVAPQRAQDNTSALALHPRALLELQAVVASAQSGRGGVDARLGQDAAAVLARVAGGVEATGARYGAALVAALAGCDAASNASNGPAACVPPLLSAGASAAAYYAACTRPLLLLLAVAACAPRLPHVQLLLLWQATAVQLAASEAPAGGGEAERENVQLLLSASGGAPAAALVAAIRDAMLDLPRSLWPEMSPELSAWRSDGAGAPEVSPELSAWRGGEEPEEEAAAEAPGGGARAAAAGAMQVEAGAPGEGEGEGEGPRRGSAPAAAGRPAAAASRARALPPPSLWDARFDTRAGHRYYDYIAMLPVVRDREAALRRLMAAESAAAAATREGGRREAQGAGAGAGAEAEAEAAAGAGSNASGLPSRSPPSSSSAASASASASASAGALASPAPPPEPPSACEESDWRSVSLASLSREGGASREARDAALQRRDAAVVLCAGLARCARAQALLLDAPGLLPRLVAAARTSLGYAHTPILAAHALGLLARGSPRGAAAVAAAGGAEARRTAAATHARLAQRKRAAPAPAAGGPREKLKYREPKAARGDVSA